VGAVYASGEIDALEKVVLQLDWKKIAYLFREYYRSSQGQYFNTRNIYTC